MYLSPRSAASSRASGVRRVVVPAAGWLSQRVDATGLSWTSDGSTRASGAGEGWTSVGDVGFMSTTFRTCGPAIRRYVVSGVSYGRARSGTVAVRHTPAMLRAKTVGRRGAVLLA